MRDITDKQDNTAGSTGELTAAEFNDHKNELQQFVESTQQILDINKTPDQLSRAGFIYGTASQTMQDAAPSANVIELTPLTGASGLITPDAYSQMDGVIVEFDKGTANTSTTVTVNFGKSSITLLGAKSLKTSSGTDPAIGQVVDRTRIQFDVSNDWWVIISTGRQGVLTVNSITADYTILDNDGYDVIESDPSNKIVVVTLPTVADNVGRILRIKNVDDGITKIDGEGSETINGRTEQFLFLMSNTITIVGGTTEWLIIGYKPVHRTGYINRNVWTTGKLGSMEVDYSGLTGTFDVGEIVTGGTSGATGRIMFDSGSTLKLYLVSGNGGIFTNTETITGSNSGATATVNEGTGSTKNQNHNLYHGTGRNIRELAVRVFVSTDGTDNNSFEVTQNYGTSNVGAMLYQVDTNNYFIQEGNLGLGTTRVAGGGASDNLDTEDWYYDIVTEYREW